MGFESFLHQFCHEFAKTMVINAPHDGILLLANVISRQQRDRLPVKILDIQTYLLFIFFQTPKLQTNTYILSFLSKCL